MLTTKKLSDYLPLYTGCKVIIDSGGFNITGGIGRLVGCTESRSLVNYKDDLLPIEIVDIKPILRPFSDITEAERKEIYKLIFNKEFHGSTVFMPDNTTYNSPRWILSMGVDRVGIETSGTVWADCDLHPYKYNRHGITRYLLKQGLDLFGLIEDGLALEQTTKEQPATPSALPPKGWLSPKS